MLISVTVQSVNQSLFNPYL